MSTPNSTCVICGQLWGIAVTGSTPAAFPGTHMEDPTWGPMTRLHTAAVVPVQVYAANAHSPHTFVWPCGNHAATTETAPDKDETGIVALLDFQRTYDYPTPWAHPATAAPDLQRHRREGVA
jgi:hypothetical protein